MKTFKIGSKEIGDGCPVYIVFEAGQTHTGFESAKELIDAASESGADAIKFQMYDTERLVSSRKVMDVYEVLLDKETGRRETVKEPLIDSLKRHEFTRDEWIKLKKHADRRGITFFSTVNFPEEVDFLMGLDVGLFKICSADVNHHRFIRYVARRGKPVMLDTGSSAVGEVEQAVDVVRSEGNEQIVIHHCPSGYPAHLDSINLNTIKTLKQMFEYPIAFSDHSPGCNMDIAAVALGVDMIEKTITSDTLIRDAEHIMSVETKDAKRLVQDIRELEIALGKCRREMSKEEILSKQDKRRSIFAKIDLKPGDVLTESNMDYRRPGTGISVQYADIALGRKVISPVKAGTMLKWTDFQ